MKKNIGINDFNNFMSNDYSELKATMSKMTEQLDKGYSIFMK